MIALLSLDDLDMKIIRELGGSRPPLWNVRESYSNISKRLGVDEETVRMRINRAKEHGFLPAWLMMINPLLINCREAHLDLEVREEERKEDAISKIRKLEGLYYIDDFRGKEIMVGIYYEGNESLAKKAEQIESICGSTKYALWNSPFPKPDVQMSHLDWRIINTMKNDARMDLEDVARTLDVSARTVQRRLTVMKDGRAVYLSRPPNVNVVGGLMCNFLIFCPDPSTKRAADLEILSAFTRLGASDTSPEQFSTFGISCENFADADRATNRIKAIDGVESVRMRIVKEIIVCEDWLRDQIAMRMA
jgi:DNA-binding Lrp family transcriptional regulator